MALANCPNVKTDCAGEPVIDLDKITGATEDRVVGTSASTFNQAKACSYIVSSKCDAPTVLFTANENKESTKTDEFVRSMWDVTYTEYSLATDATITDVKLEITDVMAKDSSTKRLGGDMWAVNWYDAANVKKVAPAESFAKWIAVSNTAYDAYSTAVDAKSYKDSIDTWNYFAR